MRSVVSHPVVIGSRPDKRCPESAWSAGQLAQSLTPTGGRLSESASEVLVTAVQILLRHESVGRQADWCKTSIADSLIQTARPVQHAVILCLCLYHELYGVGNDKDRSAIYVV